MFIIGGCWLRIYQRNHLFQVVNFSKAEAACLSDCKTHAFQFPIICMGLGEKVILRVIMTQLQEEVEMPERVSNFTINYDEVQCGGTIFCSGVESFSLYAICFQLHNVEFNISKVINLTLKDTSEQNE